MRSRIEPHQHKYIFIYTHTYKNKLNRDIHLPTYLLKRAGKLAQQLALSEYVYVFHRQISEA